MEVNSRFDIGDVVWLMSNNRVVSNKIRGVYIRVEGTKTVIEYSFYTDDSNKIDESFLFESKEELLKSL